MGAPSCVPSCVVGGGTRVPHRPNQCWPLPHLAGCPFSRPHAARHGDCAPISGKIPKRHRPALICDVPRHLEATLPLFFPGLAAQESRSLRNTSTQHKAHVTWTNVVFLQRAEAYSVVLPKHPMKRRPLWTEAPLFFPSLLSSGCLIPPPRYRLPLWARAASRSPCRSCECTYSPGVSKLCGDHSRRTLRKETFAYGILRLAMLHVYK
ncbi:hypothetical protein EDC01DRAFT_74542 [Geopyxis carbonaria]|nr:hypothetical protein EDC01DRAFT_74542 [Geopyxis carbonaria]